MIKSANSISIQTHNYHNAKRQNLAQKKQLLARLSLNKTNCCQEKNFIIFLVQEITRLGQRKVCILVSNGFNHDEVFGLQTFFRQSRYPIYLVGLSGEPVHSSYGFTITADYTIDQLNGDCFKNSLIIVPGDPACTNYLLMDARVYRFVSAMLQNGGFVAITKQASEAVIATYQFLLSNNKSLVFQSEKTLESFARFLLSLP